MSQLNCLAMDEMKGSQYQASFKVAPSLGKHFNEAPTAPAHNTLPVLHVNESC
jgi:hypothetical protein